MDIVELALKKKDEARRLLEHDARGGHRPSLMGYPVEHFRYAYGDGWEAEIARLDAIANEVSERRLETRRARAEAEALERETDKVIAEYRAAERAKARKEAQRRLSLKGSS